MDWFNQNKFRNLLIIILLIFNLITVSTIWMLIANKNIFAVREQDNRPSESVNLMQKELGLNETQTKQFENIRTSRMDEMRVYNDSLDELKKELAEELFKDKPDTILANLKSIRIGDLQSKIENIRFNHFRELMSICTPAQKEKLKPIMVEIFGRKPPRDEPPPKRPDDKGLEKLPQDKQNRETGEGREQFRQDERPNPPSAEEKLVKYSERLNLTQEQKSKVLIVLQKTKQMGDQLRNRSNPAPNEIENEKEKIRKEEDDGIMKILNEDQKKEFAKMIWNRRK